MSSNPPVTILLGGMVEKFASGELKVSMLYRDKLAERLGISPKERVTLTVVQDTERLVVSVLLDGKDLASDQELILRQFLYEAGITNIIGTFPERPA